MKKTKNFSPLKYLHSLRVYLLFIIFLFILSIFLGYVGFLNNVLMKEMEWIEGFRETIENLSFPSYITFFLFFSFIFLNNSFKSFLNILLGPLIGIFPLMSTFINGCLIGFLAKDKGLIIVFFSILPHGIFELSAFLFSAAVGLKICREVFKRKEERALLKELRDGFRFLLFVLLPLLFIAALIEAFLIVILSPSLL